MKKKSLKKMLIIILYQQMLYNNVLTRLKEEIIGEHKHMQKFGIEK
jgi:hypothetical protein